MKGSIFIFRDKCHAVSNFFPEPSESQRQIHKASMAKVNKCGSQVVAIKVIAALLFQLFSKIFFFYNKKFKKYWKRKDRHPNLKENTTEESKGNSQI